MNEYPIATTETNNSGGNRGQKSNINTAMMYIIALFLIVFSDEQEGHFVIFGLGGSKGLGSFMIENGSIAKEDIRNLVALHHRSEELRPQEGTDAHYDGLNTQKSLGEITMM